MKINLLNAHEATKLETKITLLLTFTSERKFKPPAFSICNHDAEIFCQSWTNFDDKSNDINAFA